MPYASFVPLPFTMDSLLLLYDFYSRFLFFFLLNWIALNWFWSRFLFRLWESYKGKFLARIDGIFNGLAVSNSFPNAFCADSLRFIRVASGRQMGP